MSDLHARLLAEIERREGVATALQGVRSGSVRMLAAESLAYLEALREIVELHRAVERNAATPSRTCQECAPLMWPCPTLEAVAEALDVTS